MGEGLCEHASVSSSVTHLSLCLPVCLSLCQSVFVSNYWSRSVPICVCVPGTQVCVSVCPPGCLPIHLSTCPHLSASCPLSPAPAAAARSPLAPAPCPGHQQQLHKPGSLLPACEEDSGGLCCDVDATRHAQPMFPLFLPASSHYQNPCLIPFPTWP